MKRKRTPKIAIVLRRVLIGSFALSVLAVGGVYLYTRSLTDASAQSAATPVPTEASAAPTPAVTVTPTPVVTPTPSPTPVPTPTPTPEPVVILLSSAGDCTLGGDANSGTIRRFEQYAEKNGYDYYFRNVADIFLSDDITVVNLEGPLTNATQRRSGRQFNFRGNPDNVQLLTGVEVCSFANNHALDFLQQGMDDTQAAVEEAGMGIFGFSLEYYTDVKGVTMGFLGLTQWQYELDEVSQMVAAAKEKCDILIVTIHWGEERQYKPSSIQNKYAMAIIDAGGDLVLGNHSHVIGAIRQYNGKYIVYNHGNFCFGGNGNPKDKNCFIFQQAFVVHHDGTVEDGGISVIPCSVSSVKDKNNFQPTPLTGDAARQVLLDIAKYSEADLSQYKWLDSFIGYELGLFEEESE